MIPLYAACYREESEFFLRPWNDIFWEVEQCVENGLLERSITKEEQAQLDRFFKGSILGDEKPLEDSPISLWRRPFWICSARLRRSIR
ncbi:MAG: hypothetical protein ACLRMZ_12140 [Blautia marasmi]